MDHSAKRSAVFNPPHELIQRDDEEILSTDLTGFEKGQLKIKVNRANRKVTISGGRPAADERRRIRLYKEFKVPDYCNMRDISARLDDGVLYLVMPKSSRKASRKDTTAGRPMQRRREEKSVKENSDADNRAPEKEEEDEEEDRLKESKYEDGEFRSVDESMGAPRGGGGGRRQGKWKLELGRWRLKLKLGTLDRELSRAREFALTLFVVIAVSLCLRLYLHYYRG